MIAIRAGVGYAGQIVVREGVTVDTAELASELGRRWKGRGLQEPVLRVEPAGPLAALSGIRSGDLPAVIRRKVIGLIEAATSGMPPDLRLAIHVAFAISPNAQQPLLAQRVEWLAADL